MDTTNALNDYVGWITQAKLPATCKKRIAQILDELRYGARYMNMSWRKRGTK